MQPFSYRRAESLQDAVKPVHGSAAAQFLGGGTTLLDLMKLGVMQPVDVVDVKRISGHSGIIVQPGLLKIGALASMRAVGEHPAVQRDYPMVAQSLMLAASQQLRNMARVGGNVLQRTRCNYFRDVSESQCNKRNPGSGCAALDGNNRWHAILGVSDSCIAAYPGDFAQALIALDAEVEISGANGARTMNFADLHKLPGTAPQLETSLMPGEMIIAFTIKTGPWPNSRYVKVRDRESYEFGLATAAVALRLQAGRVQDVRIGLGGVATKPWRAAPAEAALRGQQLNARTAGQAAEIAFAGAQLQTYNKYKLPLGKATLVRALLEANEAAA